jgi:ribosomal 50S subunit-associated protein YjgA (DUF615 family)
MNKIDEEKLNEFVNQYPISNRSRQNLRSLIRRIVREGITEDNLYEKYGDSPGSVRQQIHYGLNQYKEFKDWSREEFKSFAKKPSSESQGWWFT